MSEEDIKDVRTIVEEFLETIHVCDHMGDVFEDCFYLCKKLNIDPNKFNFYKGECDNE